MIRRYESLAAIMAHARDLNSCTASYGNSHNSWYGSESVADTFRLGTLGDRSLVPEAEKLLRQLETNIEVPRKCWEPNIAGPICIVPDVLAGRPQAFRHLRERNDEKAPITILACSTISGGISVETIKRRGIAVLALIMALSRLRPIALYSIGTLDGPNDRSGETILATRIETAPLDLARACWMLTSAGFARRINYSIMERINGARGSWPKGFIYSAPDPYMDHLRTTLSSDPSRTIVIKPTHLNDPLANDPLPWLKAQIARFTQETSDV